MQSKENLSWLSRILPDSKAAPTDLMDMMHGETGKLLELRRELDKEIERLSEDFVSNLDLHTSQPYVTALRRKKSEYQIEIEDFVDMFSEVLDDPHILKDWTDEVTNIGKKVKDHINKITEIVVMRPPIKAPPKPKYRPINSAAPFDRADKTSWLSDILPVPRMKSDVLPCDSDSHPNRKDSRLKNILPLPRTEPALVKPNTVSVSERSEMSDWLKNILPLPRENVPLVGALHLDTRGLKNIQPVPRSKDVLTAANVPHDKSWLKNILPLPRKQAKSCDTGQAWAVFDDSGLTDVELSDTGQSKPDDTSQADIEHSNSFPSGAETGDTGQIDAKPSDISQAYAVCDHTGQAGPEPDDTGQAGAETDDSGQAGAVPGHGNDSGGPAKPPYLQHAGVVHVYGQEGLYQARVDMLDPADHSFLRLAADQGQVEAVPVVTQQYLPDETANTEADAVSAATVDCTTEEDVSAVASAVREAATASEEATKAPTAKRASTEAATASDTGTEAATGSDVAEETATVSEAAEEAATDSEAVAATGGAAVEDIAPSGKSAEAAAAGKAADTSDADQAVAESIDFAQAEATDTGDNDERAIGSSVARSVNIKSVLPDKNHCKGEISKDRKTKASRMKLMWERFWNMKWMMSSKVKDFAGSQVTRFKENISKCLNNTSRALFLKLRASAFLAVDNLTCRWSCHLEVCLFLASQAPNMLGTYL